MSNIFQAHLAGGFRRERGSPTAGAKENETFALGEDWLVIGAFRVDPEFQHAAGALERARHPAFAVEFARVSQIDEDDVVLAVRGDGLLDRQRFDLGFRLGEELLVAFLDLHDARLLCRWRWGAVWHDAGHGSNGDRTRLRAQTKSPGETGPRERTGLYPLSLSHYDLDFYIKHQENKGSQHSLPPVMSRRDHPAGLLILTLNYEGRIDAGRKWPGGFAGVHTRLYSMVVRQVEELFNIKVLSEIRNGPMA